MLFSCRPLRKFQHTAARRRLVFQAFYAVLVVLVSTHSRPKAAGFSCLFSFANFTVSTHSRPKAAGFAKGFYLRDTPCFNTQPPEGGWAVQKFLIMLLSLFQHTAARRRLVNLTCCKKVKRCFNTQPPEGGWAEKFTKSNEILNVSTHSRPKAAGQPKLQQPAQKAVSTHSRPKAAGHEPAEYRQSRFVSTHSRPKAAGHTLEVRMARY